MIARFCPTCGEDLREFVAPGGPSAPEAGAHATVETKIVRREVTTTEVERLWGLKPLPFHIVPFGVVEEGGQPVALAAKDNDDQWWRVAGGRVEALAKDAPPVAASPELSPVPPATVPEHVLANARHVCLDTAQAREALGSERYGR